MNEHDGRLSGSKLGPGEQVGYQTPVEDRRPVRASGYEHWKEGVKYPDPVPGTRFGTRVTTSEVFKRAKDSPGRYHRYVTLLCDCGKETESSVTHLHYGYGCAFCAGNAWSERVLHCRWCPRTSRETGFNTLTECWACERQALRRGRHECCGAPIRVQRSRVTRGPEHECPDTGPGV